MTTQHAKACTTQTLSSHLKGPDIGSLHMMLPNPCLGLGIEPESTTPAHFSRETPAAANCHNSNSCVSTSQASHKNIY